MYMSQYIKQWVTACLTVHLTKTPNQHEHDRSQLPVCCFKFDLNMACTDKATRGRRDVEVDDRAIRRWRTHHSPGQPPNVMLLLTYDTSLLLHCCTVTTCTCSWLCITFAHAVISLVLAVTWQLLQHLGLSTALAATCILAKPHTVLNVHVVKIVCRW